MYRVRHGTVITSGSRCQDCKLPDRPRTRTTAHAGSDWRWRKLSARMRKLSPFCEKCGSKNKSSLTVDHVIPVSDDATLAYEPLNLRLLPIMQCEPVNQRHRQ